MGIINIQHNDDQHNDNNNNGDNYTIYLCYHAIFDMNSVNSLRSLKLTRPLLTLQPAKLKHLRYGYQISMISLN